jgi:hypothetical protein
MEHGVGRPCTVHEGNEKHVQNCDWEPYGKNHVNVIGTHGRILRKWV